MKNFITFCMLLMIIFCISCTNSKKDTPFVSEYKKRYYANNVNLITIYFIADKACRKKCTRADLINLRRLAEAGDIFAISMMHHYSITQMVLDSDPALDTIIEDTADKGEPVHAIFQSVRVYGRDKDFAKAEHYAKVAADKGYINGYWQLLQYAHEQNKFEQFCEIGNEGYKKFGIEFFSSYIVRQQDILNRYFSKCTNQNVADYIKQAENEGELINGYLLVHDKKYPEAYNVFEKLYKTGDSLKVRANAGYCIGKMLLHGAGSDKSPNKGQELIDESFENGIIYRSSKSEIPDKMPAKLEIISYSGGNCEDIGKENK